MDITDNRKPNMSAVEQVYLDTIAALQRQADFAGQVAAQAAQAAAQAQVWAETSADQRDQLLARLADVARTYKADFPND